MNNTTKTSSSKRNALDMKAQYVIPIGNGWMVKGSQSKKFTVITDTKREAVSIARNMAKNQGILLIVYNKDGKIHEKVSYAV
jgi:hypothetical protein